MPEWEARRAMRETSPSSAMDFLNSGSDDTDASDSHLQRLADQADDYDGPEQRLEGGQQTFGGSDGDDESGGIRNWLDDGLRSVTGGQVGISDDFTTTEDTGESFTDSLVNVGRVADQGTRRGTSFLLDNERYSVQDTLRQNLVTTPMELTLSAQHREDMTGELDDEDVTQAFQDADAGATEFIDRQIEGTTFDDGYAGTATDATRWVGDTLVTEAGRIALGTATGIDTREGSTDYEVGLAEAADIGLTIGTAGVGRVGGRALREGAQEGGGLISRVTRQNGGSTGTSSPQQPVTFGSRGDDAASTLSRSGDDAARAGTRNADDTFNIRQAETITSSAPRSVDDAGRSLTDRIGDAIRSFGGGTPARLAGNSTARYTAAGLGIGAGAMGAGVVVDELTTGEGLEEEYETEDYVFTQVEALPETGDHPEGGALYEALNKASNQIEGYTVIVGQRGRNLLMIDSSGNRVTAPLDIEQFTERRARGPDTPSVGGDE